MPQSNRHSNRFDARYSVRHSVRDFPVFIWNPVELFKPSDIGVAIWTDSQQTNFQEDTGQTPAGDGNTVGLILDRSQGLVLGPELVTNGGFDGVAENTDVTTLSGWSTYGTPDRRHVEGERLRIDMNTQNQGAVYTVSGLTDDEFYEIRFDYEQVSGNNTCNVFIDDGTIDIVQTAGTGIKAIFQANGTSTLLHFRAGGNSAGSEGYYDNISVKHLPGNHFTQSAATARPQLNRIAGGFWYWEGDGIDDFIQSTFAMTQPWTRISAIQVNTWTSSDAIFGDATGPDHAYVYGRIASPQIGMYSGADLINPNGIVGSPMILTEITNGISSKIAVDNGAYVEGNAGSGNPNGVTLGANDTGVNASDTSHYGFVMIDRILSDGEIALARNFFAQKAGVTL